jgi:hypothetical protein
MNSILEKCGKEVKPFVSLVFGHVLNGRIIPTKRFGLDSLDECVTHIGIKASDEDLGQDILLVVAEDRVQVSTGQYC